MNASTPEELLRAAEEERQRQAAQQQPAADGGSSVDLDLDGLGLLVDGVSVVAEGALNAVVAVGGFVGDALGGLFDL